METARQLELFEQGPIMVGDGTATASERPSVFNLPEAFTHASYADQPLEKLLGYWVDYLRSRSNPASEATIRTYSDTLIHFIKNLETHGDPTTLASLSPTFVQRWLADQRKKGTKPEGIASRLAAVKSFTNKFLFHEREITQTDLLAKVGRLNPPLHPFPKLSRSEQEAVLEAFNGKSFEDKRNKALVACFLDTGRRFSEILGLTQQDVDLVSGDMTVRAKGGDIQQARLSSEAIKILKVYLKVRPDGIATQKLWVAGDGSPLKKWGARSVFRQLKVRSGVERVHPHLFRHNWAQVALDKGAPRLLVMDVLGHKSEAMSRRYAGEARKQAAARDMPQYSPLGAARKS